MTLPMVPWMRWRGHGWWPCVEMVAAMLLPAVAVIALLEGGVVASAGLLMTLEHAAMFVAMFADMIARPDEYCHARPTARRVRRLIRRAGAYAAGAAMPLRSATSATMSRMMTLRSKSFGV